MLRAQITQKDALASLLEHSRSGGEVIPLLGAGVSADSGIPALSELTRYLAKVLHVFEEGSFAGTKVQASLRRNYLALLDELGWPDPNDLNLYLRHSIRQRRVSIGNKRINNLDMLVRLEIARAIAQLDENLGELAIDSTKQLAGGGLLATSSSASYPRKSGLCGHSFPHVGQAA